MKPLTQTDFIEAARLINCEPAALEAVAKVESAGSGFLPDGRLKILFERHKFHEFTRGKHSQSHPDICNPKPGGYLGGQREWERFNKAAELDAHAARLATSFGQFQIMGFNAGVAGYPNVEEMIRAFEIGYQWQLKGFITLLRNWNLDDELRERNWAAFARRYNGKAYAKNRYDQKMAEAYRSLSRKYSRLDQSPVIRQSTTDDEFNASALMPSETVPLESPVIASLPNDPIRQITGRGWQGKAKEAFAAISALGAGVAALVKDNPWVVAGAVALIGLVIVMFYVRSTILDRERLRLNADPTKYNVR